MGQLDMQNFLNPDMTSLNGVAAHRTLPVGETLGASFFLDGERLYVTQAELDRVKNLPTAEEAKAMVATFRAAFPSVYAQ